MTLVKWCAMPTLTWLGLGQVSFMTRWQIHTAGTWFCEHCEEESFVIHIRAWSTFTPHLLFINIYHISPTEQPWGAGRHTKMVGLSADVSYKPKMHGIWPVVEPVRSIESGYCGMLVRFVSIITRHKSPTTRDITVLSHRHGFLLQCLFPFIIFIPSVCHGIILSSIWNRRLIIAGKTLPKPSAEYRPLDTVIFVKWVGRLSRICGIKEEHMAEG